MPTVLVMHGWRLFFYANENHEPIHVHARKADAECKLWLNVESYEVVEAWSHGLTPAMRREIRRIVFEHYDYLVQQWTAFFTETNHEDN